MTLSALVFVAWANYHSPHAEWGSRWGISSQNGRRTLAIGNGIRPIDFRGPSSSHKGVRKAWN